MAGAGAMLSAGLTTDPATAVRAAVLGARGRRPGDRVRPRRPSLTLSAGGVPQTRRTGAAAPRTGRLAQPRLDIRRSTTKWGGRMNRGPTQARSEVLDPGM